MCERNIMETIHMNRPKNKRALFAFDDIKSISAHVNAKTMGIYNAKSTNIIFKKN